MSRREDWATAEAALAPHDGGPLEVGTLLQALSRMGPIRVDATPPAEPGGPWRYELVPIEAGRRSNVVLPRPVQLRLQTERATAGRRASSREHAERARELQEQGLTHEAIAEAIGRSPKQVQRYLAQRRPG